MKYALKMKKRIVCINTNQMKDQNGNLGLKASKPQLLNQYDIPCHTYVPCKSDLKKIILGAKNPSLKRERSQDD